MDLKLPEIWLNVSFTDLTKPETYELGLTTGAECAELLIVAFDTGMAAPFSDLYRTLTLIGFRFDSGCGCAAILYNLNTLA